jgi:magnesium chelatase family protein
MLVAAMNPCPCGYLGSGIQDCECSYQQIRKYRARLSGPLLDRIDLHCTVASVPYADLVAETEEETSGSIRERVEAARQLQRQRFAEGRIHCNAEMKARHLKAFCELDADGHRLMERCMDVMGMSARGYSRILKVARTLADLVGEEMIGEEHLAEAVGYRQLDTEVKQGW